MKNSDIVAKAQQVLDLAKRSGFSKAELQLIDDDDNVFSSIEDFAFDYSEEGPAILQVAIKLADLELDISRDPEDDDADPVITYP